MEVTLDRERGSATLELAVLAPALLLLLGLVVAAGRVVVAGGAVEEAARDAARQASIARDAATAGSAARSAAQETLAQQGLRCTGLDVTVDTRGFATPVGQPGEISTAITCTVPLSDLAVTGLPGSTTLHASFTSPLDRYRERA